VIASWFPSHSPFGNPFPPTLPDGGKGAGARRMAAGGVPRLAGYGEGMKEE